MFPVLFEIAGNKIHAYGFFIAIGYLFSLLTLFILAHKRSVSVAPLFDLAFLAIFSGVIGARILFVAINFSYYKQFPGESLYIWKGGLVFYGGLLLALPSCAFYVRMRNLPLLSSLDMLAPATAIGHAFGRLGCLGAGCCHGFACDWPWAVRLNTDLVDPILRNVPVHPTQLYEAVLLFLLAILMFKMILQNKYRAGIVACVYLSAYSVIRIIVEFFRGDQIRGYIVENWISTSQFISIFLLLGGLFGLRHIVRRNN